MHGKTYLLELLIFFICTTSQIASQPEINSYGPPKLSKGNSVQISLLPMANTYSIGSGSASEIGGYFSIKANSFRFSDKLNYGCYGTVNGFIEQTKSSFDTEYKETSKSISGTLYLTGSYYLIPDKFYLNGSFGSKFEFDYVYNYYSSNPDFSYRKYLNTAWLSAGYGRIYDASQLYRTANAENVIRTFNKQNIIIDKRTLGLLTEIFDKRNYGEYSAKYKDNADIVFFSDMERILINSGIIPGPLNAEAVMKLYQTLSNTKFIYYPMFKGFQVQAEQQYLVNSFSDFSYFQKMDYLTFSGIYGLPISKRFNSILSGFLSIPTRRYENDGNLFYYAFRSPFINFMPVVLQKYLSDNSFNNLFYGGSSGFVQTIDPDFVAGLKIGAFYRLNSFAGSRLTAEFTYSSRSGQEKNYNLGSEMAVDFNILSRLRLSFVLGAFRNSQSSYSVYSSLQSTFNIF